MIVNETATHQVTVELHSLLKQNKNDDHGYKIPIFFNKMAYSWFSKHKKDVITGILFFK